MTNDSAVEALKKLDEGEGINSAELDAVLGERLIEVVDDGDAPPYFRVTGSGNAVLGHAPPAAG